jgi:intracellular sulfur oxidation DsrE/DsrF family protein
MTKDAAKAVWDFTTGDERRFRDRLELALDAASEFRRREVAFDFVVLLHGAATQFAARSLAETKFTGAGNDLDAAHAVMRRFCEAGGRIQVCRIAMDRSDVAESNLVEHVDVERNVYVTAITLQNQGYAYIPVY